MILEVNNTYSQLKEVLLGDISFDFLKHLPSYKQHKVEYILKQTQDDFLDIQSTLEAEGVKVYRPSNVLRYDNKIQTPLWTELGSRYPMAPRDIFLIVGNTIIESAPISRFRYFEHWAYKDIMIDYFKSGAKWVSMPKPLLGEESYHIDTSIYTTNYEPLLESASVIQHNKDIFVSTQVTSNELGIRWLQDVLGNEYTIHKMGKQFVGHLDAHMCIVRPGLIATYHSKKDFPKYFKDWEFINLDTIDTEISKQQQFIHDNIQDDDHENTNLLVNLLSINEHKLLLYDHHKNNKKLLQQFDKYEIEPVFIPFTYCHFFNQGITCITLETYRDDTADLDS